VKHKIDANQPDIVRALKAVGASVYFIDRPVDLLVGYKGHTYLIEVKNLATGYGRSGLNVNQKKWAGAWRGEEPVIVTTVQEALAAIGIPHGHDRRAPGGGADSSPVRGYGGG
jgi:hypothetical protein